MNTQMVETNAKGWVECRVGDFHLETSWEVEPGQVLVLFGPSGAGKSTTLRAIAGLLRPVRGHIEVGGQVVYDSGHGTWVPTHERRLGYLTQQYHLFPHLKVAANIAFGLPDRNSPAGRERVSELSIDAEGVADFDVDASTVPSASDRDSVSDLVIALDSTSGLTTADESIDSVRVNP